MNNKLKLGVLLLVIVLMFQNCQNDDDLLTTKINSQTSYKRVSLDQVLKLKPIAENIKKVRPLISNIDSRTGETFLGLDNVLTDNIIQITNTTNVSTYTFGIDTNFETTGYIENLHLVETGQDYIAYIIRYIPDLTWATNPDNYTPEGDLVLDLATFQGDKIKYTLDREEIWTTIPPGNARGAWIEECSFSLAETCDYGSSLHVRGPECGGNFGVGIVETCVSVYTGGGLGNNPGDGYNDPGNGGGNTSNNNCEEVIGTLIQDSQPISGMNTGCTTNDTTGVIVVDVINFATSIIDCINGTGQMDDVMLSKNMTIWLYQNQENLEVLNLFLINNGCSEEAQEFGIAAIEALAQDGEVDFEDIEEVIGLLINPYVVDEDLFAVNLLNNDCAEQIIANEIFGTADFNGTNANLINKIRNTLGGSNLVTLSFVNANELPFDANAATSFDTDINIASGQYLIQISLSDNYLDNVPTKLSIALTVIHEMVHAMLMHEYLQGTLLINYPNLNSLNSSFETFLNNRNEINGQELDGQMHHAMANYFLGTMSYSLYKYAQNAGMTDISHQYCKDITKGSFYNTPSMLLIDTGDNTAEELNNKYTDEQDNTPNAQGDDC
ncbi:hypothetical protein [uncultured Olleya sp.]|uniref:hypothetical protein n=1 Tax=uncultured Olleya sp. TaxID=757243 RepID=UPI00259182BE|nr:hypothetical protein [uncultured Olleya sp.]